MSTSEIVEVIRVIRYRGPRKWVERTVSNSIQGTKHFITQYGNSYISAVTVSEFPEILTPIVSDHVADIYEKEIK